MKKLVEKFQKIKFQTPSRLGFGIFLFGVFFSTLSFAQTAARWQQVYGGPGHEYGYRVRACMDQGYIVAGSTASAGVSDGYVVRTDSLGLVMWSKYYTGNNVDVLRSLCQLPDSGYIMAGYSNSAGNGGYDGWVLRTDKNGDVTWSRYIGTSDWDFFYDVAPTWDGGFVLADGTYGLGAGDEDMYFVKLNDTGATVWTKTFGGVEADEARAIIQTNDSMLAACGFTYSLGDTLGDSWILRMDDLTGDTAWTRTAGQATWEDKAWGISDMSPLNRFVVVGETSVNGDPDAYIMCFNYDSTLLYTLVFGGAGSYDYFAGAVTRPNGTLAALGYTDNPLGAGNGDLYFFHNRTGWFNTGFGTLEPEAGYSIDLAHDDGYIACGYTEGFNSYQPDLYLLKIDTLGLSSGVLAIQEQNGFSVSASTTIYPNPSTEEAIVTINSYTPIDGDLRMEIYDLAGRKIMQLPSSAWQVLSSQEATCRIPVTNFGAGLYQYIIHDNSGGKCSGKLIVAH